MRFVRRLRAGLPDRRADGEIGARKRARRSRRRHHLRLLRRRMLVQGRGARRRNRPHGAEQGRAAESRPLLRQGTLRVGLRDASGSRSGADDARNASATRGARFRGTRRSATPPRKLKRVQQKYGRGSVGGITSSRCTNEEAYLVQKLVRAAFGNNNVDTCARVCHSPTGYGLKTALRHPGRHAGFRLGAAGRRDPGDRREPDRGPSGIRLDHEAAPARGREADRRRPAQIDLVRMPHIEADVLSATHAWHQRRADQCDGACGRDRRDSPTTDFVRERCEPREYKHVARIHRSRSATRPRRPRKSPACPRRKFAAPRVSSHEGRTRPSTTASA